MGSEDAAQEKVDEEEPSWMGLQNTYIPIYGVNTATQFDYNSYFA